MTEMARIARAGHPEARVLSIGVNDISAGVEVEHFQKQYAALVAIYEPTHVVGVTGAKRDPFNKAIREIAAQSIYIEPLEEKWLQLDGIHYSNAGAQEWKDRLLAACGQ